MKYILLPLLLVSFLASACNGEQAGNKPAANRKTVGEKSASSTNTKLPHILLKEPVELITVELPPEIVPVWRKHLKEKPTLVLLSNNPLLGTIPKELSHEVATLVEQGHAGDFRNKARVRVANPILLPAQTLTATLQAGFFSQVMWIFPTTAAQDKISLDIFRQQLIESGSLQTEEAASLTVENGVFRGQLQGTPFLACSIQTLPKLTGPVALHLDLSYFSALYENEISTPIFSLVHHALLSIRKAQWPVIATSLSLSTSEGDVPLELRFLKNVLTKSFQDPSLLDQPLPELWSLRKDARYLETFFQIDPVLETYQAMASKAPQDASIQFDLYRAHWMDKTYGEALEHLAKAGALDSVYGLEYLNLVHQAMDEGNIEAALDLLTKASRLDPENPFIPLQMAETCLQADQAPKARLLIDALRKRKWSTIYYPEIPALLAELDAATQKAVAK